MIFGRGGFIERSSFIHQLTIYGIAWLYRLISMADALYQSMAVYKKTSRYQHLRDGRWNMWIPSVQRGIDRIKTFVNDLIVAQGLTAEKLAGHNHLPRRQRRLMALVQIVLAFLLAVLFGMNESMPAAAPIHVEQNRPGMSSVQAAEANRPQVEPPVPIMERSGTDESSLPEQELLTEDKPDVDSLLAQVTANGRDDSVDESLPTTTNQAGRLDLDEVAPVFDDLATTEPAPMTESSTATSRRNQLAMALEAAIDKALNAQVQAERGNVVVVEPQIQPSTEESVSVAAIPAPPSTYPSALVLGQPWDTFTPLTAAEIDHYWLDIAFLPGYNQLYSPSYQFGSTAGGRYRPHHGVDISNPTGTPIISMAAGEIVHAGPDNPTLLGPYNNFYGNSVVILLDRKLSTPDGEKDVFLLYGHMNDVQVERGQRVEVGDPIGSVGMTGIAIGPHLHIEVRVGQNSYMTAVNPALWIRPLPGTGSVAVRLVNAEGRSWVGAKVSLLRYEGEGARWVRTIETYRDEERLRSNPLWGENGALSNLDAGNYYIAAEVNGEKVGQNITVRDGETTFVELRTQQ